MGNIAQPSTGVMAASLKGTVATTSGEGHDLLVRGTGASKRVITHGHASWFYVIDASNINAPAVIGSLHDTSKLFPVSQAECAPGSRYIAVVSDSRFTTVDVQTETAPAIAGYIPAPTSGPYNGLFSNLNDIVVVGGRYAYVTATLVNTLLVIDLLDPVNPVIVAALTDATNLPNPQGIAYDGSNTLWICANGSPGRLTAVDITTRTSPAVVGSGTDGGHGIAQVALFGNRAFSIETGPANYMATWNIANRTAPAKITSLANANIDRALGIALTPDGNYACIPCQGDIGCVAFVDISNPASPAYHSRVLQPVAGGPGNIGSGELYHCFTAQWDEEQQGFWIVSAGSGYVTFVKTDRSSGESLDGGNGPRIT